MRRELARGRMAKAMYRLLQMSRRFYSDPRLAFAYGVVENTELPYAESDAYLYGLLHTAEQRMLESGRVDNIMRPVFAAEDAHE